MIRRNVKKPLIKKELFPNQVSSPASASGRGFTRATLLIYKTVPCFATTYYEVFFKKLEKGKRKRDSISPLKLSPLVTQLIRTNNLTIKVLPKNTESAVRDSDLLNFLNLPAKHSLAPGSVDWPATVNKVPEVSSTFESKDKEND